MARPGGNHPAPRRRTQAHARAARPPSDVERRMMSTLVEWTDALCAELGLDPGDASQKMVLNLARVVAHTVDRPAAPLAQRGAPGAPHARWDLVTGAGGRR